MAAVEARKLTGEMVPMDASQAGEGKLAFTLRRPIGIVGAISPFNFPLNLVAHKLAPALAAGCPVVLKPATATPLSALLLAELMTEAGLPPGWLSVVVGNSSELGDVLVEDERVKLITFTGSGLVGWALRERAPRKRVKPRARQRDPGDRRRRRRPRHGRREARGKRVRLRRPDLHLGAADLRRAGRPRAVPRAVPAEGRGARRRRPGRRGDRRRPADRRREPRPRARVDRGGARGGREVLAGGDVENGLVRPTVIGNAAPELKVSCDEIFGPVCTVNAVDSLEEAFALANGTRYGLQAGDLHREPGSALRAAQSLDFGGVTINEAPAFRADQMPYGGVKDSGNTREGPAWAVREMTEERLVVLELPSA